jgi:hypothetical protein
MCECALLDTYYAPPHSCDGQAHSTEFEKQALVCWTWSLLMMPRWSPFRSEKAWLRELSPSLDFWTKADALLATSPAKKQQG